MTDRTPIQIRDTDGSARKTALRIAKRNGLDGISDAISYALAFTDGAERTEKPPLEYAKCSDVELRTLIVYGYDHYTRAAALDTLQARQAQEATK